MSDGATGRKLTLLDLMIVVAAVAVGLAWTRATVFNILERSPFGGATSFQWPWFSYVFWWSPAAVPPLTAATVAVALLRLRRPRPSWRRLTRQPGAVACGVVAALLPIQWGMILLGKALVLLPGTTMPGQAAGWPSWSVMARALLDGGLAVLGAWLPLAAGGRWRAEPSWFDRAGRLLGACWIGLFLIHWLVWHRIAA